LTSEELCYIWRGNVPFPILVNDLGNLIPFRYGDKALTASMIKG
jgi:hypothetical protein